MTYNFSSQDLRVAILTNQLLVTLQPKVCLKSYEVIGHEALLRWNHPSFGLIPANQWIQIAEERDLIAPLTFWLAEQIATYISQTQTILPTAINVSPATITPDFANHLLSTLKTYHISPELLIVELTESTRIENYNTIARSLNILRKAGVRVSLDDFGTGYNSMRTLVELEVDEIKIDRILMQSDHPNSPLILSTIINLAKEINLSVVCEGIENNRHLNRALKLNADIGQGFLFGKPEPIAKIFPSISPIVQSA